jgi:hypothetical protein
MRLAPTSSYLSLAFVALVVLVVGCAAGDEDGTGGSTSDPARTDPTPSPSEAKAADTKAPPPPFQADFGSAPPHDPGPTKPSAPASGTCADSDDAGGAETLAKALPDTDDCNDDLLTLSGTVNGAVDVDFYKLSAKDKGISLQHPFGCRLDTDFSIDAAGTQLCVYVRCKNSAVDAVTGCAAGTPNTSSIGMKGCCAEAPGKAVPTWDCGGFPEDESSDFFIEVQASAHDGQQCLPYSVSYRF